MGPTRRSERFDRERAERERKRREQGQQEAQAMLENQPAEPPKRPLTTGVVHTGTVKYFFPDNNYGFLDCPEVKEKYGLDVYCPGEELKHKSVGTRVMFEVAVNQKGQPTAVDVRAIDDEAAKRMRR